MRPMPIQSFWPVDRQLSHWEGALGRQEAGVCATALAQERPRAGASAGATKRTNLGSFEAVDKDAVFKSLFGLFR